MNGQSPEQARPRMGRRFESAGDSPPKQRISRGDSKSRETERPGAAHKLSDRRAGIGRRFARRTPGRFTGRAAILALVVALLVVTLSYPVRQYLAQEQEITELEEAEQRQAEHIAELEARKDKWDDPAYIKAQARKRLQYVEPGEVAYVIIDNLDEQLEESDERESTQRGKATDHGPWYGQMWSTVQATDAPAPAEK